MATPTISCIDARFADRARIPHRPDPDAGILRRLATQVQLPRGLAAGARVGAATLVLVASLLAGIGWLYGLRGLGWFAVGPRLGDSLSLLQLAGFDHQPLLRVALAWLPAGVVAGVGLRGLPRGRRAAIAGARLTAAGLPARVCRCA
jgi:hypothetical protein